MVKPTSRRHKRRDASDARFNGRFHRRYNIGWGTILKPEIDAMTHIEEQLEVWGGDWISIPATRIA
jgi:hypothetical protein